MNKLFTHFERHTYRGDCGRIQANYTSERQACELASCYKQGDHLMAGNEAQLKQALADIIQAFNTRNVLNLTASLDDNALVYSINRHERNHPKPEELIYLEEQYSD